MRIFPLLVLLSACAAPVSIAPPASQVPPDAADHVDPPSSAGAEPVAFEAEVPLTEVLGFDSLATQDSIARADSLADAFVLEMLEMASDPDTSDAIEVTWDIDVSSYADHHRVKFYLDFFQGKARERMGVWLDRLPVYEPMIRQRLQEAGLPEDLVYLALIESGMSNSAVSRSRAVGMWQFITGTARMYGLRVDRWVDERRDPIRATDAAARYLADLTRQFGSPYVAAAAYNAGPGRVARGLRRIPDSRLEADSPEDENGPFSDAAFFHLASTRYIRQETKDYVPKLIAAALIAKQPERYGFTPPADSIAPYRADSMVVDGAVGLDVIAKVSEVSLRDLRDLNPHLRRGITPPSRKTVIRLPVGAADSAVVRLAAIPPRERVSFLEHAIRRGETLGGIARRYGVSVEDLRQANPRVRDRALRIGQILVVPTLGSGSRAASTARAAAGRSTPARTSNAGTHVVRRGETLGGIAGRYGVSVASLREWNGLRSNLIRAGQSLRVRGPTAAIARSDDDRYRVRNGDTLSEIAERHGVSVRSLMRRNGLRSTRIRSGQVLTIPESSAQ